VANKQFFFLAGLQRSGGTLLASILNQNPDIHVSPSSPLFRLMRSQIDSFSSAENVDYPRTEALAKVVNDTPGAFYSDKTQKFIIDKNLNWQTPTGLQLIASHISETPKIICPVRTVTEILASFNSLISSSDENTENLIDEAVMNETFPFGDLADRRAEWLMRHDKDIQICLNGMKLSVDSRFRDMFIFVEYDDLVEDAERQVRRIYEFLGIPYFEHEYQNIEETTGIPEISPVTRLKNLHKVRPKIEKKSISPEQIFNSETINRYSNLEFWRNL
jgi:sulfotransferase